ncbi:MAG: hypothetical protein WBL20_07720 [Sphingobium sp.]|uniref:hypothetical protein n=1 Tax=Sphingobium sp. TaxID=1912891 RepID=UPI003BB15D6C
MSLGVCIPDLIEQGKIPKAKAREAQRLYDELLNRYDQEMGDAAAKAAATERTIAILKGQAKQAKRRKFMQIAAMKHAHDLMRGFDGGGKADAPINPRAAVAFMARDDKARYSPVELRHRAVRVRVQGMMDRMLADLRKTVTGKVRDPVLEADIVRALNGEAVANASANEMAEAVRGALHYMRQRFNQAGGHIRKMEGYDLPHRWSAQQLRAVPFEQWLADLMPALDRARMIDRDTGLPMTDARLTQALQKVYERTRTEGWSDRKAGAIGATSIANRHAEERFLHFRSADDWLRINEKYGAAGAFDTLMGHVETMSREIAAMEILGPNPEATIRFLGDSVVKEAQVKGDGAAVNKATAAAAQVRTLWDEFSGRNAAPVNERLARNFGTVRAVQTSAKLGSAVLSAVGDFAMTAMTRRFNGMPVTSMLGDYMRLMRPGSKEDMMLALHMGAAADEWTETAAAMNRLTGEELTGEFAQRLANGTLRLSGLSRHTMALRATHARLVSGLVTRQADRPFTKLNPDFRAMLDRYGIGAAEWDHIRATPLTQERGTGWILPDKVADQKIGDKLLEMIQGETDFAVPTVDLRTRATVNSIGRRGTWTGEVMRSAFLFKSFGLTVINLHGRRMLDMDGWSAARYAAGLTVATTLAGALAVQMKEVAKGRDPQPMQSTAFWGKAMLQGGGWGIFGDFIGASESRFGGGLGATAAGPMVQTASNVADLTVGNTMKLLRGDDTDFWPDTLRLMRQEVPVLSSLWYARPIYDRLILNSMDRMIDPDHDANVARLIRKAEDQGTGYWLPPDVIEGELRAPEFGNAMGAPPEQ